MIHELTAQDLEALLDLTPKALPDNPTKQGWTAQRVKEKMWQGYQKLFSFLKRLSEEVRKYGASDIEIDSDIPAIMLKNDKGETIKSVQIETAGSITQGEKKLTKGETVYDFVKSEINGLCNQLQALIEANEREINRIKIGPTVVASANKDGQGRDIYSTYETKADSSAKSQEDRQFAMNIVKEEQTRAISEETRLGELIGNEKDERESAVDSLYDFVEEGLGRKEDVHNKSTVINSGSNDRQYPSAKAVNDFVNSSINSLAAYYITKNGQRDAFSTRAELMSATQFYSGGVRRFPTKNDYCIVRSDESHDNATTRYLYNNGWEYQYTVNEKPFTEAQIKAIDSGITEQHITNYNKGLEDILKRIKYSDAVLNSGGFIGGFNINGEYKAVTQNVEYAFAPKIVNSVSDLTNADREFLYMVKANRHLYYWNGTQWEDLGLYNQDYVLVLDIVDNLTTQATNKPLSAKQGYELEQKKLDISDIQYATLSDLPNIFGGTR